MGEFDEVEVRNRHSGNWVGGFELCDTESTGDNTRFRIRRCRDGAVLPGWFSDMEIRPPQSPRDALQQMPHDEGVTPVRDEPVDPIDRPGDRLVAN